MKKLLILCVLYLPLVSFAQENFTSRDKTFIRNQTSKMEAYLKKIGVMGVGKVDSCMIDVIRDPKTDMEYAVLMLKLEDSDGWLNLRETYGNLNSSDLERDVFEKFVFLCEVQPIQALLSVYDNDDSYHVMAGYNSNYTFERKEKRNKTKKWVIKQLSLPRTKLFPSYVIDQDDRHKIWKKIRQVLKEYYQDKGSWFSQSKFDVVTDYPNELHIKISNLKRELIYDSYNHYEVIEIKIIPKKYESDKIEFDFRVDAKYGTSVFKEPRMGDFKAISGESKYQMYINEYALQLRNLLYHKIR